MSRDGRHNHGSYVQSIMHKFSIVYVLKDFPYLLILSGLSEAWNYCEIWFETLI